jgi:hypothetical protein
LQYVNKGIGFEALGLWMDYLFEALPRIARLDLRTWSGNTGMMDWRRNWDISEKLVSARPESLKASTLMPWVMAF